MDRFVLIRSARTAVFALVVAGALIGVRSGAAPQGGGTAKGNSSGNAENGKKIFRSVGCWECHGFVGQGGNGARIGPPPLALPAFLAYLRHPKGQMPPYEAKSISDSDLADVYAFLQSVPKPPPVKDIPLLNN
jgi:mono/diheme cytochrome c family protein